MSRRPGPAAWIALAAVCLFWGTTYLGIRIAIESFPPPIVMSARYLLSGSILLFAARLMGAHLPRGRELRVACICGALTLGIGNGSLVYAEELIPSGLASLFVTLSPFWMVGIEAFTGGEALHAPTIAGMAVGFAGTALLLLPGAGQVQSAFSTWTGFLILQVGIIGWSLGSLYQRRQPSKAHPIVTGAVQQLAAGIVYVPVALLTSLHSISWSPRSALAVAYLVIFGSIVGYSAFIFSMDRLPVAIASVYPYFNTVVAMGLGWLFFREPFGLRETAAMLIIFSGVAIVKWQTGKRGIH
jgi:drug/metabolite transporter (DMT)-like permease